MFPQESEDILKVSQGDLVILKRIPKWPENCKSFFDGGRLIKPELLDMIGQICEVGKAFSRNNILLRHPSDPTIKVWVGMEDIEVMFTS